MKKRILAFIFVFVMVLCIGALCACDLFGGAEDSGKYTSPGKDKTTRVDQDIYAVYQLYLSNGGKLTYDEWLATIKGEKGDKGDQGLRGEKGDKGDQGIQGEKGSDGLTPFIGDNGNWWIGTTDTGTPATSTGGGTFDNVFYSGKCGENVTWTMYKDGRLVITGEGEMDNWMLVTPWYYFSPLIKEVTIEDGVTSIVPDAFMGCVNLTNVAISNSVTSIGGNAFGTCMSLKSITLPDSVTNIGSFAFSNCKSLENITIPESVTNIGDCAFEYCIALTSITIPDSVTSIEASAFWRCESLTSITIPDSVTSIGESAFSSCTSLTSVTIPVGVTSIGDSAFSGCDGLTSVHISDIASWCGITFGSDNANPLYYAHNLYIDNELVTDLVIPDTVKVIKDYAFEYASCLTSVTIPDNVTSIGDGAFCNCTSLTSVTIPDNVTSIGRNAFSGCSKLVEVYNKSSLNITKGSSYYGDVGYYAKAIYTAPYESKLSIDENGYILYTDGDDISMIGYAGTDTVLTLPAGITEIIQYAFYENRSITSITIPDSVTSIGEGTFYNCTSLTSVTIPDSVTSIGWQAFYGCYKLVEVYNKSSLNITKGSSNYGYVGYYAKNVYTAPNESKLSTDENGYILYTDGEDVILIGYIGTDTDLTLPAGITGINQYAFYNNTSVRSITIPDSVTSIGSYAFEDCPGLTSITFDGTVEQWENAYVDGYSRSITIYCIDGTINI